MEDCGAVLNPSRAKTPQEKKALLGRLLTVWLSQPEFRLGQLIENARVRDSVGRYHDLFYTEDYDLIQILESYY